MGGQRARARRTPLCDLGSKLPAYQYRSSNVLYKFLMMYQQYGKKTTYQNLVDKDRYYRFGVREDHPGF